MKTKRSFGHDSIIHVVGGARGIGRWFAEHVFVKNCNTVRLYDVAAISTPTTNPAIAFTQVTYDNGTIQGFPGTTAADIVVLAVPVHEIEATAQAIFPLLGDNTLVLDMSSVKVRTHVLLERVSSGRLQIMGLHPLFGPQMPSPVGQTIALTQYDSQSPIKVVVHEMFRSVGLLVKETTPQDHDKAMLYVQTLTHFTYLTFAQVLSTCPSQLEDLLQLATPPFQMLSAFAGRILGSPLATYANIQRLDGAKDVRKSFISACQYLDSVLSDDVPLDTTLKALTDIVQPFTGAEISQCRALSATATDSIQVFEQRLFSLELSQSLCGIYRIDKRQVVPCKVCEIRSDCIVVEEQFKVIDQDGHTKYAIAVNDIAIRNYRRHGITIGQPRRFVMLKRNIRVLSEADFELWVRDNIKPISNDINIQTQVMVSDVFCEMWLPQLVTPILSVTFVEAYRRKGQPENILLRIVHTPETRLSDIRDRIQKLLDQIGTLGGIGPTTGQQDGVK